MSKSELTSVSIIQAGTTKISGSGECILDLVVTNVADGATATFKAKYNAAPDADSIKLRYIATIEGISYGDYTNIASIAFTFKFITDEVRVCNVSYVYKSKKNGTEDYYSAKDNTLYAVYTLNNINKEAYKGKSLSNLQLVITFADGSSKTVAHENITLPEFTSTIAQGE